MTASPEAALAEANAVLEAIDGALNGHEPSDFMLSCPIVRKAWETYECARDGCNGCGKYPEMAVIHIDREPFFTNIRRAWAVLRRKS